jgi:nucleotide-binding universal stress UspA family protein
MFRTIVVGTDGSTTAGRAVEVAARLARDHGAVLHIVSAFGKPGEAPTSPLRNQGSVEALLADAAHLARTFGAEVQKHVLDGDPGDQIGAKAAELEADLIVVGNRLLRGIQGYFVGSVPAQVLREAPCSVLVVRTTGEPERPA